MAYRSSVGDLPRAERWDRDRFYYEHDREHDRQGDVRERVREEDDHVYSRPDLPLRPPPERFRERSADDRFERRHMGPQPPYHDDEKVIIRENRRVIRDDEADDGPPRFMRRRSPPPEPEIDRRVVIEKERFRSPSPRPAPRPRPGRLQRRQSSLDTFDRIRRPSGFNEREEFGPPARRRVVEREDEEEIDFRAPPYVPIPLPRSRALPPPRRYAEREHYDEIQVSDPHFYSDEDFHAYPERVREKEIVRTRRRDRSRESHATSHSHHSHHYRHHSHRENSTRSSSSRSSSVESSSSSSTDGARVKSEYPKKGKTRIPARLVSKRAIIDLGYPFEEEGKVIVVQKALGQENIDDLLKLSEDYKKSELEMMAARPPGGEVVEERREDVYDKRPFHRPFALPPAPAISTPPPVVIDAVPAGSAEVITKTVIREASPVRSHRSYSTSASAGPVIIDARSPREVEISSEVPVGPLALVERRHSQHQSRDRPEIRSEIRYLERELARRERHDHFDERDIVRAERLSSGELVLYEEKVEKVEEPSRGVRIEKDKKGRMSISVPRYR